MGENRNKVSTARARHRRAKETRFRSWVQSMVLSDRIISAFIGGIFVVATAIISVVLAQAHVSGDKSPAGGAGQLLRRHAPAPKSGGTQVNSSSPSGRASGAGSGGSGAGSGAGLSSGTVQVLFSGPVEFGTISGLDFDVNPPTSVTNESTVIFDPDPPSILTAKNAYVAIWPQADAPTQAECRKWVLTHPLNDADIDYGTQLCIHTPGLRTAYLKITNFSVEAKVIGGRLTIWSS